MDQVAASASNDRLPDWASKLGMGLLLVSLGILFLAGWLAWLIIRWRMVGQGVPLHSLQVPGMLWLACVPMFTAGVCLHGTGGGRMWLWLSLGCACGFVALQVIGMVELVRAHQLAAAAQKHALYGAVWALVAVHALHLLAGVLPLSWFAARGASRKGLRLLTAYWHFLEGVWVVLLGSFAAIG